MVSWIWLVVEFVVLVIVLFPIFGLLTCAKDDSIEELKHYRSGDYK